MSSTPPSVLRSAVFARVMRASAIFVAVALLVMWAVVGTWRSQVSQQEWAIIDEEIEYVLTTIEDMGFEEFIDEYEAGRDRIWEDDFLYEPLEEAGFVYMFRDEGNELLAGYGDIWPSDIRLGAELFHPDIETQVRGASFGFDGGYGLVARFEPESRTDALLFAQLGTFALFLVGLPLSMSVGYFLSRAVFRQIEAISATTASVAAGNLDSRAPETGNGDEFDRLSGGINRMLVSLEQLNANIEAVSVGVAHDLKTPLANIGGRLELMGRDASNPAALSGHIEAAQGYLNELLRIFDALLRLGEVESGRRKAAFAEFSLSDVASDMGAAFGPVFEDAQKSLRVQISPDLNIMGDRELIEQLLANLLENALEHSRDAAQAHFVLKTTDQGPLLIIGDDGPGIPPAHRPRVFERFYRADSSRTHPGSGLGLSLVKAISDLHGAQISLDETAQGAVFLIQFPRA